jgi:hypothetical protein
MTRILLPLLILGLSLPSSAEDNSSFPGVEKLMSPEEYSEAGLDKLGPQERDALNQWLVRYTAWQAPKIRQNNEEVKEVEKAYEQRAVIKQPFKGWSGRTYFYLENGEVWQQRTAGKYQYSGDETEVVIRRNLLGYFKMELISTGRQVGVKQVK